MIAVIGTGGETESAVSDAREVGRLVAEHGWILVTGGRNAGVMRAANRGAKEAKESVTVGILPDGYEEVSPDVDISIFTDMGEARNNVIVRSADIVIACGADDPGTASEIGLALKGGKTVILLNASDAAGIFFSRIGGERIREARSPEQAIQIASNCPEVKREGK